MQGQDKYALSIFLVLFGRIFWERILKSLKKNLEMFA